MSSTEPGKFTQDPGGDHPPAPSLPFLKRKFAFRFATTSYIIPAPIVPNLHFLGRHLDEVELVLFESGDASNLPSRAEIREMAQIGSELDITYNIHLPGDLFWGDPDPILRKQFEETALRFYERTLPLDPTQYILHLDSRRADGSVEENQSAWMERVTASVGNLGRAGIDLTRVAVENLEYPLERILPLVELSRMTFCLDIGHLLRYGYDLEANLQTFLPRSSMVHLHGVCQGEDHRGIEWIPQREWETLGLALQDYQGGVSLEVFALADLHASLPRIQEMAQGKEMS
jgi:sugar phosphate isomerase/epimerase